MSSILRIAGRLHNFMGESIVKQLSFVALLLASIAANAGDLPDPRITPGAIDPSITQDNIQQTICVKGYTKTVRPPAYYTNKLKKDQIRQYGYADRNPKDYEEDHLVAISVGGHPTDPRNLWPQPRLSEWNADKKGQLEYALYQGVCHHDVTLADARAAFATNWIAAYQRYGHLLKKYHHGRAD
jgi:hypothetical protein